MDPAKSPPRPAPPIDEADLAAKASGGDPAALTALLCEFGPLVRRRLTGKIGRHWNGVLDEDDVMQVSYLEAFVRIGRFESRGPGSFVAWLTQIAENNLRDAIRGLERAKRPDPRRRVQAAPAQESYASLVMVLGVTTTTPSRAAAGHEMVSAVDRALAGLPPDYRTVIRKYDLDGCPIEEVAAELKRKPGAVYMLRARAHDRLRELLGTASMFFSHPA